MAVPQPVPRRRTPLPQEPLLSPRSLQGPMQSQLVPQCCLDLTMRCPKLCSKVQLSLSTQQSTVPTQSLATHSRLCSALQAMHWLLQQQAPALGLCILRLPIQRHLPWKHLQQHQLFCPMQPLLSSLQELPLCSPVSRLALNQEKLPSDQLYKYHSLYTSCCSYR